MAIKRAPVISAMQVYMVCDVCDSLMTYEGFDYGGTNKYKYKCTCGHTEYSEKMYPYQQVSFDRSKEETVNG